MFIPLTLVFRHWTDLSPSLKQGLNPDLTQKQGAQGEPTKKI